MRKKQRKMLSMFIVYKQNLGLLNIYSTLVNGKNRNTK